MRKVSGTVLANSSCQADGPQAHGASVASVAGAAVVIRLAYDGRRVRVGLACSADEDRTKQAFKDECDINVLMKRYERTGILPSARDSVPQYGDVTAIDFESSMQQVAEVRGTFSMLDARTRARFENDPAQMLDFLADPANIDEAVKMGLMAKPKEIGDGSGKAAAGVASVGQAGVSDQGDGAARSGAAAAGAGAPGGAAVEQGASGAGA